MRAAKLSFTWKGKRFARINVTRWLNLGFDGEYAVALVILGKEREKDGGRYIYLVVSLDTNESNDGKRVAWVHVRRELAERAEIWLTTSSFDGKQLPMTRYHHVIRIAKFLKNAAAAKPAAEPAVVAPPATELRKE